MPPTSPRRATAPLTRLGLPADLAPCCVIGVDPGATTGISVLWCNGDKTAHALTWSAKLGTEPDWQTVHLEARRIAGAVAQWRGMAVWAAERMVAVHGNTAQANSVFGCATTEGQLYQATATKADVHSRHLYPAAVWRSSIGAAARKRAEAHKRVERWAEDVWLWHKPEGVEDGAEVVLPAIHELEALGIAYHCLLTLRREAHVAALPEQARLAITAPKGKRAGKRPQGVPAHLLDRVATEARE